MKDYKTIEIDRKLLLIKELEDYKVTLIRDNYNYEDKIDSINRGIEGYMKEKNFDMQAIGRITSIINIGLLVSYQTYIKDINIMKAITKKLELIEFKKSNQSLLDSYNKTIRTKQDEVSQLKKYGRIIG